MMNADNFKNSILNNELTSITADVAEAGLDSFLKDGFLKDLPGINILYGFVKFGHSLREKFAIKKLALFFNNLDDISDSDREKFIERINESTESQGEFYERLLLILDRLDELEKARIVSNVFKLYSYNIISQGLFLRLSTIVRDLYLADILAVYYDINYEIPKPKGLLSINDKVVRSNLLSNGIMATELKYEAKNRLSERPGIIETHSISSLGRQLAAAIYYSDEMLLVYKKSDIDRFHSY